MKIKNGVARRELCFGLRTLPIATLSALALLTVGPAAKADGLDLVQNGSFEETSLTGSGLFYTVGSSATQPSVETDWTVDCAGDHVGSCVGPTPILTVVFPGTGTTDYGYQGNALYPGTSPNTMPVSSPDGGNFVAADGDSNYNASFSQTITGLTPGDSYLLAFYQAAAQQVGLSGATTEYWQVTLGTETLTSAVMNNPSEGFTPWNLQDLVFQATSATEVLTFLSVGTPNGEPPIALLDGVSLVQTAPEPSGLALVCAGVLGLFAVRKYRQRRP
jgi:hypothetical protein